MKAQYGIEQNVYSGCTMSRLLKILSYLMTVGVKKLAEEKVVTLLLSTALSTFTSVLKEELRMLSLTDHLKSAAV